MYFDRHTKEERNIQMCRSLASELAGLHAKERFSLSTRFFNPIFQLDVMISKLVAACLNKRGKWGEIMSLSADAWQGL
jgi:hypothetical protein